MGRSLKTIQLRLLNLALADNQLLAQEGVLGDQLISGSNQIDSDAAHEVVGCWAGPYFEVLVGPLQQTLYEARQPNDSLM